MISSQFGTKTVQQGENKPRARSPLAQSPMTGVMYRLQSVLGFFNVPIYPLQNAPSNPSRTKFIPVLKFERQ